MSHAADYHAYISSDAWRKRHPTWLKRSGHRCALCPWVRVGAAKGKYHKYNMHHMHYANLENEQYWWDVMPLCPFAHDRIIHGLLSSWKRPSQQKCYPNLPQRAAHAWCRCTPSVKVGVVLMLVAAFFQIVAIVKP